MCFAKPSASASLVSLQQKLYFAMTASSPRNSMLSILRLHQSPFPYQALLPCFTSIFFFRFYGVVFIHFSLSKSHHPISFISRKKASQFFVGWPWIFPIYHSNTFLHLWKGLKIGAKNGHFLPCFLLDFCPKTTISCGLNLYFFLKPQFCIIITDSTWVECGNISHPLTFTTSYPRSARYFISLASVAESQLT